MTIELSKFDPDKKYEGLKKFNCGHTDIDRFVRNSLTRQVKKNLSVAYVLTDAKNSARLAGFLTLAQHAIDVSLLSALQLGSLPRMVPCTRLIMLGVDQNYQGQKLGLALIRQAILTTKNIAELAGCYGLYLDADPGAISFYKKLGFALLDGDKTPLPLPMFLARTAIY